MKPLDTIEILLSRGIITYFSDWTKLEGLQLYVYTNFKDNKVEIFGPYENNDHVAGVFFTSRNYSLRFTYNGDVEIKFASLFTYAIYKGDQNMFPSEFTFPGFSYDVTEEFLLNPILFDYGKQMDYFIFYIAGSLICLYILVFWIKFGFCCCKCCCY